VPLLSTYTETTRGEKKEIIWEFRTSSVKRTGNCRIKLKLSIYRNVIIQSVCIFSPHFLSLYFPAFTVSVKIRNINSNIHLPLHRPVFFRLLTYIFPSMMLSFVSSLNLNVYRYITIFRNKRNAYNTVIPVHS